MKRNWLLFAFLFSLALNLGALGAWGYYRLTAPPPPPPPPGGWLPPGFGRLLHNLQLDPEQRVKLQQYFQEQHQRLREPRLRLAQARSELVSLLQAETPDEAAILAKVQEIVAYQGQLEHQVAQALLVTARVLRPEQKKELVANLTRCFCRPNGHSGRPPGEWLRGRFPQ